MSIILPWTRNISRRIHTSNKALRRFSPIILRKSISTYRKSEFRVVFFFFLLVLSIWLFTNIHESQVSRGRGRLSFYIFSTPAICFTDITAASRLNFFPFALSVWLVFSYVFSVGKSFFTGRMRIVLVFLILNIAALIWEFLLRNTSKFGHLFITI